MVFGCGIDTEELFRFRKYTQAFPVSPFVHMVLSEEEIANYLQYDSDICLSLAFTCKEAVFKALGNSWTNSPIDWKEIRLLFHQKPENHHYDIKLHGYARQLLEQFPSSTLESQYTIHVMHVTFKIIIHHAADM